MLNQLDRNSKTLTVANQTEVPILHYANIILNTTIDENSRYFSVLFAVADIKYNILGTPFFEDKIQNILTTSKHVATLPTGHIGYIEVPITNEKPKFFQVNDINTLIHNVTHTYHPEITEPVPQTNYIVQYDDPTTSPPKFSLHQIYMTNDDIPNQTSPLYNVQPTSHTSEKRIFPSLPFTSENLKFIIKFNFHFSDLTDSEYITLCNMLLKYKTCYATHKNDVGKISTPFRIRPKPNAQLMTQRPSKVPIHYRDKLKVLLKELEKYNVIKQIGSSPQDKPVYGTTHLNPLIIIPREI